MTKHKHREKEKKEAKEIRKRNTAKNILAIPKLS
jgi:hypothetical protein